MAKARERGQIIERGNGSWLVKVYRGRDGDGKRLYSNHTVRGKRSDAQKYLTAKMREKDLGVFIEVNKQTLNEHLDNWLKLIKARVAEQTFNSYETILRVHVRPNIGQMRLSNIKTHDVQKIYAGMLDRGLAPRTIKYVHSVLAMAIKKAIELDYIVRNPCAFVELPKQVKEETKAMSPEQAALFLRHAENDRMGLVFEVAMISGMRPEEYLALRWSDIDFVNRTAKVQRALVWLKGGYKMSEPKTKKSRRTIPLPNDLMSKLKEHKKQQLEHRFKLSDSYQNLDLVFATELGTPIHYRNLTQRHYEKILKNAELHNVGLVLYSLRHTCATLLLASGENPKVVADPKISEKSFLAFWVQIMPSLLFLLIMFLLVSLGTNTNNIKSLDASIAGYGIGFLIALGAGGILYIYLTMFLERRIEEQSSLVNAAVKPKIPWVRLNTELILLILTFIAVILSVLLIFQHPFKNIFSTQSLASLMFFGVSCLISAFTLGYGIRLQSLESSRQQLEVSCDIIQTKLIRISRPLQIYLTPRENANFNHRFITIRNEIMNLMLSRTMMTRKAITTPLVKDDSEKNKFFKGLNKWIERVKSWQRGNSRSQEQAEPDKENEHWISDFTTSDEIKLCFPKLEAELGALEAERNEVRERINLVEREIKNRKEEQGDFYEKKRQEIKDEERRSRNYHKAIINREKAFNRSSRLEHLKKNYFTQKISEGYELGDWFRKHNPTDTLIPDSTDSL